MADKTLGIIVTGDIDDITEKLDSLLGQLGNLQDQVIELSLDADTSGLSEVSSASENVKAELESVSDSANDVSGSIGSIDSTTLNEAASHANSLGGNLNETSKDARQMGNEVTNASNQASDSLKALTGAAAAVGGYLALDNMVSSAGAYEDSWTRMTVALGGTVDSVGMIKDNWSSAISEMSNATGRGAGNIREFITQMTLAGVESQDVISSAFQGIAGAAYVTGNDINTMTYALQRATRTGLLNQRTLTALGLSTQDIMNATGKSIDQVSDEFEKMTPTARASFLAMVYNAKYGTAANEAYKQSWDHVNDALNRAKSYLFIVFGQLLLPVVVPAIEALTGYLNGLSKRITGLDPVSKGFLSVILLLAGAFVTVGGMIAAIVGLYNALQLKTILLTAAKWLEIDATNKSSFALAKEIVVEAASQAKKTASILIINAGIFARQLYNAEIWKTIAGYVREGAVKAASIAKWVLVSAAIVAGTIARQLYNAEIWATIGGYGKELVAKAAYVIATTAERAATIGAAAAQWLLNAAMTANPIGLVVVAVAALVAGLYLLYQNNEQVRGSVNNLWNSLVGFVGYIQSAFVDALVNMQSPFIQLADEIIGFGEDLYDAGRDWISNLIQGMQDSIPSVNSILQRIADYFPHSPAKTGPLSEVTPDSMNSYGTELGTNLGEGVKDGAEKSLSDKQFWDIVWSSLRGPVGMVQTISGIYGSKQAQNDLVEAEKKRQEAVKTTFDELENLDSKTKATFASMTDSSMTNAEKIAYNMKVAAHNIGANFELAAERAEAAMSRMSSMASAMGIDLPKTTYTPAELLSQRNETLRALRAQRNTITQAGPSAYGSTREYHNALKDIDNQIKQYSSASYLQSIMNSGKSIGQSWTAGISTGITSSTDELNAAIAQASQGLIAHSPPKEGPLRTVDLYGESIGATFTEGIVQGLKATKNRIMSQLENIGLSNLSQTPLPSSTSLGSGGIGGIVIQFTGPITIPEGSDPYEVGSELSRGAADGLVGRLLDQATNSGYDVMNQKR
jgi:hypothetical protein